MSRTIVILLLGTLFFTSCEEKKQSYDGWEEYLGSPDRSHFTNLDQISPENLKDLVVAWTYESPDTGQMQMNPIVVDGVLYGVSAALKAFALDATTGKEIWKFGDAEKVWHSTSRGLAYWENGEDKRILYTIGKDLICLDAKTGKLIQGFGEEGKVDLHIGLPEVAKEKFIISNTPGTIFKDLIVMPVRLSEGADAAPGDIRAFNIKDGSLAWSFHVFPYPGENGYETGKNSELYKNESGVGAGNNWAGMTLDESTGIIYVPTGSFSPDFYGGNRIGTNLFSNCLLAINAKNGSLLWHQQLVHHDIWDRDLPAPPNLLKVKRNGKKIEAVAQITKQGYVFVFNRKTGEPLFDIEEVSVPTSNLFGEEAWPTQPIPVQPASFSRRSDQITEKDFSPFAPNKDEIIAKIKSSNKGFFSPPDTLPTLLLPGYDGGGEWGGAGVDPSNGIIYINANEMGWFLQMEKTNDIDLTNLSKGESLYLNNCSVCHMKDKSGNIQSGYPSLVNTSDRLNKVEVLNLIKNGKGMMPGFSVLKEDEHNALIDFIFGQEKKEVEEVDKTKAYQAPYRHLGYTKFLDANGLPALSPPWGTLNAIDLNTGEYLWKIPFGEIDSLTKLGYPPTGTENYGGPIITENGLLIIAATKDSKIRIFDRNNGKLLWEDILPASSFATPATYLASGKQFIVLACGGEKLGTKPGNKLVAYALKSKI